MVKGITVYKRRPSMNRVVYAGMDVNKESYTVYCYDLIQIRLTIIRLLLQSWKQDGIRQLYSI